MRVKLLVRINVIVWITAAPSNNITTRASRAALSKKYVSFPLSAGNAIQAFGNGTDVGVWQPMSPVQTTTYTTTPYQRNRERNPNTADNAINTDPGIYHFCGSLQVRRTKLDKVAECGRILISPADILIFFPPIGVSPESVHLMPLPSHFTYCHYPICQVAMAVNSSRKCLKPHKCINSRLKPTARWSFYQLYCLVVKNH